MGEGGESLLSCCCREVSTDMRLRRAVALAWSVSSDIVKKNNRVLVIRVHSIVLCC